jgi:hypothetical protein
VGSRVAAPAVAEEARIRLDVVLERAASAAASSAGPGPNRRYASDRREGEDREALELDADAAGWDGGPRGAEGHRKPTGTPDTHGIPSREEKVPRLITMLPSAY